MLGSIISSFSTRKQKTSIPLSDDPNIRYFHDKGLLNKLIPVGQKIPEKEYNKLVYIDKVAININREKERILIAKGLHNSQFDLLNNIIVILSLIIASINLIASALDSQDRKYIGRGTEVAFDILVGIFGLVIAIIAKMRDQKEDLVHSMLTAVNSCDDFLNDLENKIANNIRSEYQNKIEIGDEDYKKILIECDKVMAKFTSQDAQAVTNGSIYCLKNLICCFRYDPEPLRKLMTKYNDDKGGINYEKFCYINSEYNNYDNMNLNKDVQIRGDVKIDGNVLLTGRTYNNNNQDFEIIDDDTEIVIDYSESSLPPQPDISVTGRISG